MMFKRRERQNSLERIRIWLWPRRSWSRSLRYVMYTIVRLCSNPHALALGCAAGVFAACTPLLGGQIVLATVLAIALRASVPAAVLATFFGNPLSWPLIWPATYVAGVHLIGEGNASDLGDLGMRIDSFWQALLGQSPEMIAAAAAFVWPLFKPMLAGSLPIGLADGFIIYYMMRSAAQNLEVRRACSQYRAVVKDNILQPVELAKTRS